MNLVTSAVNRFQAGCSCSQAIVCAFGPRAYGEFEDFDEKMALKSAAGFSGGMGRTGGMCGAVSGAIMVLGLKFGPTRIEDRDAMERTSELVRQFMQKFEARNGALNCRDLLKCDISTPEGRQIFKQQLLRQTLCTGLVESAAAILDELLGDMPSILEQP